MAKRSVRKGGKSLNVPNSGREVWLYDKANRDAIRNAGTPDEGFGGMPPKFEESTAKGLIVGYSLYQDDEVQVAVYVGDPLTGKELAVGHWLEPQVAFLRMPSGSLCVESNDASRVGHEQPTEKGATVKVPKGDYRLTLYRVDHEGLERDGIEWDGPQEVIVLTPGGSIKDAASELLPFEERRDTNWVGKYSVRGNQADALIWFGDRWDTFALNLDASGAKKLGLEAGSYFQVRVPGTGHTLVGCYAKSWADAKRLPLPDGIDESEYGFASLMKMQDWNGAEVLFCRRDTSKMLVEDRYLNTWLSAIVERLDAKPKEVKATERGFIPTNLRKKQYYDPGFLGLILSEVLPGVGELDELLLPDAVDRLDEAFDELDFAPGLHDITWTETYDRQQAETTARLYTGQRDSLGVFLCMEATAAVFFLFEREDGTWILTGCADDIERWIGLAAARRPDGLKVECQCLDETLEDIHAAHQEAFEESESPVVSLPAGNAEIETAFRRFLTAALG